MTGREGLDLADLAALASEMTGRSISRTVVSEADMEANARRVGISQGSIDVMLGYYRAARAREFALIDPALARILGREPQTMRAFLRSGLGSDPQTSISV